ncbi:hypothetical protein [uncultured Adlercreutzia sp.]|uniref:hypothetical protein n=1 Tax=uncultured Adlercreutzia sp. TaxID=875803 RepID=UPI0026F3CD8C|nr:hypothetical protein [uncultured Adlercreutzia sp.]
MEDNVLRRWTRIDEGETVGKAIDAAPRAGATLRDFSRFAALAEKLAGSDFDLYLPEAERPEFNDACFGPEIEYATFLASAGELALPGREDALWDGEWAARGQREVERLVPFLRRIRDGIDAARRASVSRFCRIAEASGLDSDEREAVRECLDAGDDVSAYEEMCSCLFADGANLADGLQAEIRQLGRDMGADPWMWELIAPNGGH